MGLGLGFVLALGLVRAGLGAWLKRLPRTLALEGIEGEELAIPKAADVRG